MSDVTLRPYQAAAVTEVHAKLNEGIRTVLLIAPTGAGKTVIASALVRDFFARTLRVLFVAHRIELITQAVNRLGVPCDKIVAGERYHGVSACVVASLQTLVRREQLPLVDVVIVDEAHHAMSGSYQRVFQMFPHAKVIGLTATPCRLDGRGLGDVFETMIEAAKTSELIEQGALVKPRVYSHAMVPDMTGAKITAGDFNEKELERRCNKAEIRGNIVEHWLERSGRQPTVLFAASVAHSQALIADFAQAGVKAVHVDGSMSKSARAAALGAVASGDAKVLCNVGIVTEGWDLPSLAVCVLARPTASLSLLLQMWGRVMRPSPGKDVLVLDHAGNVLRHGILPWNDVPWSLASPPRRRSKKTKALPSVKNCPKCFVVVLSQVRTCPECAHEWKEAELRVDTDAKLSAIDTVDVLKMIETYWANAERFGKSPPSSYARSLKERIREGKVPANFIPFVLIHRGAVGRAAHAYKATYKRYP